MKFLRVGAIVIGFGLAGLLGQHRITESMDKAYGKKPEVTVEPMTVNKTFADYVTNSNPRPHLYIDSTRIDVIVDSLYTEQSMPDLITPRYVKMTPLIESFRDAYAISVKDARGLMQITKDAWEMVEKELDFETNWYKPEINIMVGMKYIRALYNILNDELGEEWKALDDRTKLDFIFASYNSGAGSLQKQNWAIGFLSDETRGYVMKLNIAVFNDSTRAYDSTLTFNPNAFTLPDSINADLPVHYSFVNDTSMFGLDTLVSPKDTLAYSGVDSLKTR